MDAHACQRSVLPWESDRMRSGPRTACGCLRVGCWECLLLACFERGPWMARWRRDGGEMEARWRLDSSLMERAVVRGCARAREMMRCLWRAPPFACGRLERARCARARVPIPKGGAGGAAAALVSRATARRASVPRTVAMWSRRTYTMNRDAIDGHGVRWPMCVRQLVKCS